jgi:hypothetical protein
MQRKLTRVLLIISGVVEAAPGLWALLAPISFYEDFPGFRRGWVSIDGPFNEHLLRDFGGLNLALAAPLFGAALIGTTLAACVTGVAMPLFTGPHFAYHLGHLQQFEPLDRVLILASTGLGGGAGLALLLIPGSILTRPVTPRWRARQGRRAHR